MICNFLLYICHQTNGFIVNFFYCYHLKCKYYAKIF